MHIFKAMKTLVYKSPIGELEIAIGNGCVVMIDWLANPRHERILRDVRPFVNTSPNDEAISGQVCSELEAYFDGRIAEFHFPYEIIGTPFRKKTLSTLAKVPYGTTVSYSDLAIMAGTPDGVRAIASAVARNPLNIVIPCHRVIASNGGIGGYAGGVETKRFLLALENVRM